MSSDMRENESKNKAREYQKESDSISNISIVNVGQNNEGDKNKEHHFI